MTQCVVDTNKVTFSLAEVAKINHLYYGQILMIHSIRIIDKFNHAIGQLTDSHKTAQSGNYEKSQELLCDCASSIYAVVEWIAKNYRDDLVRERPKDLQDLTKIRAFQALLGFMAKYPRLESKGIKLPDVDIKLLQEFKQITRNDPVHQGTIPSYTMVVKIIEEARKLILGYVDPQARLSKIPDFKSAKGTRKTSKKKFKETAKKLSENRILSPETVAVLDREDREIEVLDLPNLSEDPRFTCIVIDDSASMNPYRDDVIAGHATMLETLRESAKCKNDALYVIQYLFAEVPRQLNPFARLDAQKNDDVTVLDHSNYKADGSGTALYKTLYHLLQDLAMSIEHSFNQGVTSSFTIAVITDGEDNVGGVNPADISKVVQELRTKKYLRSSVVLGLENPNFTKRRLEEIKTNLGFEEAISLSQQNPKEIRRAFMLASRSSLK
ncbi:MAG: hypothetical protein BWK78_03575 [Thiotrichaceae bacterium IS1]|nr:MAG: hypothetical protein BWK78_03575 [Thiotrichaceae bacterium IS1]